MGSEAISELNCEQGSEYGKHGGQSVHSAGKFCLAPPKKENAHGGVTPCAPSKGSQSCTKRTFCECFVTGLHNAPYWVSTVAMPLFVKGRRCVAQSS